MFNLIDLAPVVVASCVTVTSLGEVLVVVELETGLLLIELSVLGNDGSDDTSVIGNVDPLMTSPSTAGEVRAVAMPLPPPHPYKIIGIAHNATNRPIIDTAPELLILEPPRELIG